MRRHDGILSDVSRGSTQGVGRQQLELEQRTPPAPAPSPPRHELGPPYQHLIAGLLTP
jgi:hypothetical protein